MEKLFEDLGWTKSYEIRSKLSNIANELKLFDKISLVFLLCKPPDQALKLIDFLLKEPDFKLRNNLFYKWLKDDKIFKCDDWQEKFAEFLAIIQNYKCVKILGLNKQHVKNKYLPKNNLKGSSGLSIRKILYNFSEELTQEKCVKFINAVDTEYNVKSSELDKQGFQYLEYKFLFWSESKIINLNEETKIELDALLPFIKSFGFSNFSSDIEIMVEKFNGQLLREKTFIQSISHYSEFYPILDENNLGLCVIINEKVFSNPIFSTRWGTGKDVERLVEVFTIFGFDIRIHSDLSYKELIETLGYYAKSIQENHSTFVLIILSHGSKNVIYTSDSQAVDINTIEMVFQAEICPNLIGKPKIFIVQSCQGEKWQKLFVKNEDSEVFCDSIASPVIPQQEKKGPQRGDSMIAWSTVQGFASFRDKFNGSWYIQELCKVLWNFGDISDLVEIFTRVNDNLRSKVYDDQFMVPSLLLSLRAKVKFPHIKKNERKGKKLMLERLIFEKYFREFVEKSGSFQLKKFVES